MTRTRARAGEWVSACVCVYVRARKYRFNFCTVRPIFTELDINELSLDATKYVTFISHNQSNVADNRIFFMYKWY